MFNSFAAGAVDIKNLFINKETKKYDGLTFLDAKSKNYQTKLINFLESRRSGKNIDTTIVKRILKDVKVNKNKALLKYEKKFSNNSSIKIRDNELKNSIKSLDKKIKLSIDLAYNRIFNFHKKQQRKNIYYKDTYSQII